jgi:three-Cys-motif partner protein
VRELDPRGFHLAFLDPFALEPLRFSIIAELAAVKRMDILVHVSVMDLQRNLGQNLAGEQERFDQVAPGWRGRVSGGGGPAARLVDFMRHWLSLIESLGLRVARHTEFITNDQNAQLYWLVLLSHHVLAEQFWDKISGAARQQSLF